MAEVLNWPEGPAGQREVARRAADLIAGGKLVVYPTDTVYGLGCDPESDQAIRRIYEHPEPRV